MKKLIFIIFSLLCASISLAYANSVQPKFSSAHPGNYSININSSTSFVDVTDGTTGATIATYGLSGILGTTVDESFGGNGPLITFNYSQLKSSLPTFDSLSFDTLAAYNFLQFPGFNSLTCIPTCDDRFYFGNFDGNTLLMDYYMGNYNPPVFNPNNPFSFDRFNYHFRFEGSVNAVPIPPAFGLLLTALIGLIGLAKRGTTSPTTRH